MIVKYKPNKITATLKAIVAGEFHDGATGETVRRCVEQLLKAGFDVDVKLKYYTMDRISIEENKDHSRFTVKSYWRVLRRRSYKRNTSLLR